MSEPNYQEAFEELQQIVTEMEDGQISVDELTGKVSRAAGLIKICKEKLSLAEQDVKEILSSIESQEIMDESTSSKDESEADGNDTEVNDDGEDNEDEDEKEE